MQSIYHLPFKQGCSGACCPADCGCINRAAAGPAVLQTVWLYKQDLHFLPILTFGLKNS